MKPVPVMTGDPGNVFQPLKRNVDGIVDDEEVVEFFIARTSDLAGTIYQHDCQCVIPVYESANDNEAKRVEYDLIDEFGSHEKYNGLQDRSSIALAEGSKVSVYVAIWLLEPEVEEEM